MFILCQTATNDRQAEHRNEIIADVYFVSNRNCNGFLDSELMIIADVYFVSNRNEKESLMKKLKIIADVYFVSNRN